MAARAAARRPAPPALATGSALQRRERQLRVGLPCRVSSQDPVCLGHAPSAHNADVRVWQIPDTRFFPPEMRGARVLTLDDTSNLHSVYRPGLMHTTGAYWDALALLPALVPPGPIALLGLGAGTVAHLMHAHHPDRVLRGWELDGSVVALARMHMGMAELEDSGALQVVIGDALVPPGERDLRTAAGVIVDLFSNGQLLPQLEQPDSWSVIRHHLAPGGRVMANLGAAPMQGVTGASHDAQSSRARTALAAMAEAFDGDVSHCAAVQGSSANLLAVSGPPLGQDDWASVPEALLQFTRCEWQRYCS